MAIRALKGFKDVKPNESYKWQYIEGMMRETARDYGYREVRTPVLEFTELFARGVGDTTDIVQKEMYTFTTKGDDSVTLKPEGTAGVVRQFIEHKEYADAQPSRMCYVYCPAYRYENTQAGRLREHHQFGIECFGSTDPMIDAEVISVAWTLLKRLEVSALSLHINNIGCPECRPGYNAALREYFTQHIDSMCEDCRSRLDKNPLRILDCKREGCRAIIEKAPALSDYVCPDCKAHFEQLQGYLSSAGIPFVVDERLVRGLDYYTRMVFEMVSEHIGAQGTVCGGGRYDKLIEELGGPDLPGAGFGMGMERLLLQMEKVGIEIPLPKRYQLFIATMGQGAKDAAWPMANALRNRGIAVEIDSMNRSLKAQFKYADKLGVPYVVVLGDEELSKGVLRLRDMTNGEEAEYSLEGFVEEFAALCEKNG